jgi:hypothetical protein
MLLPSDSSAIDMLCVSLERTLLRASRKQLEHVVHVYECGCWLKLFSFLIVCCELCGM